MLIYYEIFVSRLSVDIGRYVSLWQRVCLCGVCEIFISTHTVVVISLGKVSMVTSRNDNLYALV